MQLTVTTTAAAIPRDPRQKILFQNIGATDVYIDTDPTVTTSTGVKVPADGNVVLDGPHQGQFYVIGTASTDCRWMVV